MMMKLIYFSFLLLLCVPTTAQDTFSIIAADPETGQIGAAGASCVDDIAQIGGIQILNKVIPGRGGVNAQAWICVNPHINLNNAIDQLELGLSPEEIIEWLKENDACFSQNFDPEFRQYGVVDFDEFGEVRTAAFTGSMADDYKGHITGPTYAIQGNILLGPEVLEQMEKGFIETEGTLAEKLMAAMQGANIPGADQRCLERGTSSTSAFLKVFQTDNSPFSPYCNLNVLEMPFGEEPIDSLQVLFDGWFATNVDDYHVGNMIDVFPNPSSGKINIQMDASMSPDKLLVYNSFGQLVKEFELEMQSTEGLLQLNLKDIGTGIYLLNFMQKGELIGIEKLSKF